MNRQSFSSKPAAPRGNQKIFLTGRIVHIEWNSEDEPDGDFEVLFANDGWLRLLPVPTPAQPSPEEFVTPAANIWRIYNVKAQS